MAQITEKITRAHDGSEIVLATPLPGEGAAILKCVTEIIASSDHLLSTPEEFKITVEQEDQLLKNYLEHPNKLIITPKLNHEVVGMLNFEAGTRFRNSHQGEFGMSVHPKCQGRGIGRLMLESLIEWATDHPSIEILRLRVHARNTRALQLYANCGFKKEGRETDGVKIRDGIYDDVICMARFVR